jgi:hypothetical protein
VFLISREQPLEVRACRNSLYASARHAAEHNNAGVFATA